MFMRNDSDAILDLLLIVGVIHDELVLFTDASTVTSLSHTYMHVIYSFDRIILYKRFLWKLDNTDADENAQTITFKYNYCVSYRLL